MFFFGHVFGIYVNSFVSMCLKVNFIANFNNIKYKNSITINKNSKYFYAYFFL